MVALWTLAASQPKVMRPPYSLSKRVNKSTAASVDAVQIIDGLSSSAIILHRMLSYRSKSIAGRDSA